MRGVLRSKRANMVPSRSKERKIINFGLTEPEAGFGCGDDEDKG